MLSKSASETQKIAKIFAKSIAQKDHAVVVALRGNLGAGKTTFVQGFAVGLGIRERVLSPTFVLMKVYKIKSRRKKHLVHVDCYRMDSEKDAKHIGLKNFFKDKDAVVLIEWAEKIKNLLPKDTIWIQFKHGRKESERLIKFLIPNF